MVDFVVSTCVIVDAGDTTAVTAAIETIPNTEKLIVAPLANGLQVLVVGYA